MLAFQSLDGYGLAEIGVNRTWGWVTGAFGGNKGPGWRDVGEHLWVFVKSSQGLDGGQLGGQDEGMVMQKEIVWLFLEF